MKKKIAFCFCLLVIMFSHAQEINIIPQPTKVSFPVKGAFVLSAATVIVADKKEQSTVNFLNDYLQKLYGFKLKQVTKATNNFISLTTPVFIRKPDNEEAYTLNINASSINIQGNSTAGTFYGMQSLLQLLPVTANATLSVSCVSIEDAPRFAYRGMHLDVSRHFFRLITSKIH